MRILQRFASRSNFSRGWLAFIAIAVCGCAAQSLEKSDDEMAFTGEEKKWGIRVESIRLTGADHFVDFRFRVIDPQRAGRLLDRKDKAYLMHEPSGKVFSVPVTKVGPLRASAVDPKPGRTYVILFSNVNMIIQPEDPVTVVIGDFRTSGLRIGMARAWPGDLNPDQEAAWKTLQHDLLRTYNECNTACANNRACKQQCRETYETALSGLYMKIMIE